MSQQFPKIALPKYAWYPENVSGSTLSDRGKVIADRTNGILVGSPLIVAGKNGKSAIDYAGAGKYASIPNVTVPENTTVFVRAYWTTLTPDVSNLHVLFDGWNSIASDQVVLIRVVDTGIVQAFFKGISGTQYNLTATTTIEINKWYTFALVADGANCKIYINGIEEDSTAMAEDVRQLSLTAQIARYLAGTAEGAQTQQETLVFDYALTDDEIKYLTNYYYNNQIESDTDKQIILWNTLGSLAEINKSLIGEAGALTGTGEDYVDGKFNTAIEIPAYSTTASANFPSEIKPQGSIEFWWKPSFANADITSDTPYLFMDYTASASIICLFTQNQATNRMWIYHPLTATTIGYIYYDITFSASTWYHCAIVWDANGIDGTSDKRRFYFNGSQASVGSGSPQIETDSIYSGVILSSTLYIGNNNTGVMGAKAVIDNLKYYNYAKTDYSDREQESPSKIGGTKIKVNENRLVLWNKLGSLAQIQNSEIGVDGTNSPSPAYALCKFGNGADYSAGERTDFPIYFNADLGTIELWWRPTTEIGATTCMLWNIVNLPTTTTLFVLSLVAGDSFFMWVPSSASASWIKFNFPVGTFIDTPTHLAVVWDNNASSRIRLFVNNVEMTVVTTNNWDNATGTISGSGLETLSIGARSSSGTDLSNGEIEGVKLYNYAKNDFAESLIYEEPTKLKDIRL